MPEERQEINHGENFQTLYLAQEANKLYEAYRKNLMNGEKVSKTLSGLERIVSHNNPVAAGSFDRATTHSIEKAVEGYNQRESVKKALKESSEILADQYLSGLDRLIQNIRESIEEQEGFSELSDEDKKKATLPNLYAALVKTFDDLGLDPKSGEAKKARDKFYSLDKLNNDDRRKAIEDYLNENDLEHMGHVIETDKTFPAYKGQIRMNYIKRLMASEMIKEVDGNYVVDKEKFKAVYGSDDNYKKLAHYFVEAAEQAARQRAQKEAA